MATTPTPKAPEPAKSVETPAKPVEPKIPLEQQFPQKAVKPHEQAESHAPRSLSGVSLVDEKVKGLTQPADQKK